MSQDFATTARITSLLYPISVNTFITLCFKNSNTSFSRRALSFCKTPASSRISILFSTSSFKDTLSLELIITFTIPRAALLSANGSFEPVTVTPTPRQPARVSILSQIPATIPSLVSGSLSPLNLGK